MPKTNITNINNPDANEKLHEEQSKPGKVRRGKMNFETKEVEYDDELEEEESEETVVNKKSKTPHLDKAAEEAKAKKEAKKTDKAEFAEVKGDILTLKPSQRPTPPANERKVHELPKGYKGEVVTVNDLVTEFRMDGKKIRRIIRNIGFKAPSTGDTGFGAKARYEWESNSPILKKIRQALTEELEA